MRKNSQISLTEKNLDQLAQFLNQELEQPTLAAQIPGGAHIFHGSYRDDELTQANLELASKILLGMALGYVEDALLVMVFEYEPDRQTVIDLSGQLEKDRVQLFIETFQEQSKQDMTAKINATLAA